MKTPQKHVLVFPFPKNKAFWILAKTERENIFLKQIKKKTKKKNNNKNKQILNGCIPCLFTMTKTLLGQKQFIKTNNDKIRIHLGGKFMSVTLMYWD